MGIRSITERVLVSMITIGSLLAFGSNFASARTSQEKDSGREVSLLVTADPHGESDRTNLSRVTAADFVVFENGQKQEIVSALPAEKAPLSVEILIQDNLVLGVANEIRGIQRFIRDLPDGSRVMTGYLTVGSVRVQQDFTMDRELAADSLRIPLGSDASSPTYLYSEVVDGIKKLAAQPAGRKVLLVISDGLDLSRGLTDASPALAFDLDRAIREAQARGVVVYSFYAPSVGFENGNHVANIYGQGCLKRLTDETGGVAYFSGNSYVSFDPFFRELGDQLGRQWLITYRSSNTGSGFREVKVTVEYDIDLLHPQGYWAK